MPNPDSSPPVSTVSQPSEYPSDRLPATPSLEDLLRDRIACNGPLPFPDFMAAALYDPALGYYAKGTRQVGRSGDFFTSVSIGPLFGELLARRFLREWRESDSPARWRIIECGAHDGTLAADILAAIARLEPQAFDALEYAIPEPLPQLQAAQRQTLLSFQEKARLISDASELFSDPLPGVAFGNELLDALPFHVVEWKTDHWCECRVILAPGGGFAWETDHEITDPALIDALTPLGTNFPKGYRTEIRTNFRAILEPLTHCLSSGLILWLDYGFARPEYYHPARKTGTLRTFSNHHAGENPLATPGGIDITAHVDFTHVAETGIALRCRPIAFQSQGSWLTEQAREWLLSQEGNHDAVGLPQFQILTHPAHLGGRFQVLEFSWNQANDEISATDRHRLAL